MANALFPLGKQAFESAGINLTSDSIKVALLPTSATYSSTAQYESSYSAAFIGTPQVITGITVTNGVVNGAGVTFTAVASGSTVGALLIYKDTGTPTTSPLIAWIDTGSTGAISLTTNGGNITITWDTGSNAIFAL